MTTSVRPRLAALAAVCLLPLAAAAWTSRAAAPAPRHPHFTKTLVCRLKPGHDVTVSYMTVTFDRDGAAKMKPGEAWHLAGATFATEQDLVIGGQQVKAGTYALSARKAKDGWELTLHDGKRFSSPGADAIALETAFTQKTMKFEHLNIDVQPGGDKKNTEVFLDVRFDEMLARCLIELPE